MLHLLFLDHLSHKGVCFCSSTLVMCSGSTEGARCISCCCSLLQEGPLGVSRITITWQGKGLTGFSLQRAALRVGGASQDSLRLSSGGRARALMLRLQLLNRLSAQERFPLQQHATAWQARGPGSMSTAAGSASYAGMCTVARAKKQ